MATQTFSLTGSSPISFGIPESSLDITENTEKNTLFSKARIKNLWDKIQSQKKTPIIINDSIFENLKKLETMKEEDRQIPIAVGPNFYTKCQYRFKEIFPMLQTIVHVDDQVALGNFVGQGISPYTFIAMQAPINSGIIPFWKAAFKYSKTIFDLTNEIDTMLGGKLGPLDCYPETSTFFENKVKVTLKSHQKKGLFEIFKYKVKIGEEKKEIKRIRFATWPDLGVISVETLEKIVEKIKSRLAKDLLVAQQEKPIVHCGAGVSRSGVTILATILNEKIVSGEITMDNLEQKAEEILLQLRDQRNEYFVTNLSQFALVMEYGVSLLKKKNTTNNNHNNHTENNDPQS